MKKLRIILLAVLLALASVPMTSATTIDFNRILPLSSEMQDKENRAIEKYNQLLKKMANGAEYFDDMDLDFPVFYGGSYIDNKKQLVIQVTSLDDEVKGYFSGIISMDETIFEVVRYSINELKDVQNSIIAQVEADTISKDSFTSSITGVGISIPKNSISLHLVYQGDDVGSFGENVKKTIAPKSKGSEKPFDHIDIIVDNNVSVPLSSPGSKIDATTPPLFGNYPLGSRSIGYWATNGTNVGIVTSPHTLIQKGDMFYINNTFFGYADAPIYDDTIDAVFVRRETASFSPTRSVSGWSFNLQSNYETLFPVGASVYASGYASGPMYGIIEDVAFYHVEDKMGNLAKASFVATNGDSGGVVAGGGSSTTRYLTGMIIKGDSASYTLYCKAMQINLKLRLSVY